MSNEEILEGLHVFICKICEHIIDQVIKEVHLWNLGETGFIQKQHYHKVVVSTGSINLWSKYSDENFHINFVMRVSATKYAAL